MNSEELKKTLMGSTVRKGEELTGVVEQRRRADGFWSIQVDAAVVVEAVAKVDGGGGARGLRHREEEDGDEKARGESERDPWPYL